MTEETTEPVLINEMETSSSIMKIAEALSNAHGEFNPIVKRIANTFLKSNYADLAEVISATKDGLKSNGLSITQLPGALVLKTILMHKSGEWISVNTPLSIEKKSCQGYGAAVTYARRFAITAILSVAGEDDDDDGNSNSQPQKSLSIDEMKQEIKENDLVHESNFLTFLQDVKGFTGTDVDNLADPQLRWLHSGLDYLMEQYKKWKS
jgi:hypothetical protein